MLVSPLVLFFHPLHPLCVVLVEGIQTDFCALSGSESLVGTKGSEQAAHGIRKTKVPVTVLFCASIILPSLTPFQELKFIIKFVSEATGSGQRYNYCLLLIDKGRAKDKTYIRVSVR
jgi:hypothetical protein